MRSFEDGIAGSAGVAADAQEPVNPFAALRSGSSAPDIDDADEEQEDRTPPPDIGVLKSKFRDGELALDGYLKLLVAARRPVGEQDCSTSTRSRPTVSVTPAASPDTEPAQGPAQGLTQGPAVFRRLAGINVGAILGGQFELLERVATGGTADVYRARDLLAARYDGEHATVCVKVLHRGLVADRELLAAVLRAAATMRSLRHPNIERVMELHEFGDDCVIVCEWLEGESLAELLDREKLLDPDEAGRVLAAVAAALGYAHAQGIAHGDIKPGNVFLAADGRVILLDFGFYIEGSADAPGTPAGITRIYASGEVLEGAKALPSDDVYSVACMAYRMLSGEFPYGRDDALAAEATGIEPVRPTGLSSGQWRTLRSGLAFRRSARAGSVAGLVAPFAREPARPTLGPALLMLIVVLGAGLTWLIGTREAVVFSGTQRGTPVASPSAARSGPAMVPARRLPLVPVIEPVLPPPEPAVVVPVVAVVPPKPVQARPSIGFATSRVVVSESTGFIRLRVRAAHLQRPVRLSVHAIAGSARVNEDFIPPFEAITLSPRQPSADVLVSLLSDTTRENVEDFSVVLAVADGRADLRKGNVEVVLTDDD